MPDTDTLSPDSPAKRKDRDDPLFLWRSHVGTQFSGLLDGGGWRFDPNAQLFVSDTGARLNDDALRSLAIHFMGGVQADLRDNAALLLNGDADVDQWHHNAQQTIDDEYFLLAALGAGGLESLTDGDLRVMAGRVGTPNRPGFGIAEAESRLQRFAEQLEEVTESRTIPGGTPRELEPEAETQTPAETPAETGQESQTEHPQEVTETETAEPAPAPSIDPKEFTPARILRRAGQSASPGYAVFQAIRRDSHQRLAQRVGLRLEELNVLMDGAKHCATTKFAIGCPECTAAGWVQIEALPDIGLRTCGSSCLCHFRFRIAPRNKSAENDAEQGG